jgi:hypothetical protein
LRRLKKGVWEEICMKKETKSKNVKGMGKANPEIPK